MLLLLSLRDMSTLRSLFWCVLLGTMAFVGAEPAASQAGRLGVTYGRWWVDEPGYLWSATYHRRLFGPVDYGLGAFHFDDRRPVPDLTQTGGELSIGVGRLGRGPYVFGTAALGLRHVDGNTDAAWSAGVGYQLRVFSFLRLGFEGGYRWEDTGVNGFWALDPIDRSGFMLQGHLALGRGRRASAPRGQPAAPPPMASDPGAYGGSEELFTDSEAAALAGSVAETALDAMGTPYRWGGSDEDGYDCSGLIQWAYGEHGILLPRTSRDQARLGTRVDRSVGALLPGDILGFAVSGSGVSHVGLYVGQGDFIHSSSAGVRLSSLTASDPDSRWWQQRWVAARRILN